MSSRPGGRTGLKAVAIAAIGLLAGGVAASAAAGPPSPGRDRDGVLEGLGALEPFHDRLAALERGETRLVRVLWIGDSHVAADLLTGHARRLLQARFGDAGPGLVMPGDPWRAFRHDRARSRGDGGFETVGLARDVPDPLVGLWGVALVPRGQGSASLEGAFAQVEVSVLAPTGEGCVAVSLDGVTAFAGDVSEAVDGTGTPCARVDGAILRDGGVVAFVEAREGAEARRTLTARDACGGAVRILGADLRSGRPGILVDSVGINGAEISWLGRPGRELRRVLLERLDPALVVVSFGTNDMGRPGLFPEEYEAAASGLLRELAEDAPEAALLVTGPLDRDSRSPGLARLLAVNEPAVIGALRSAAVAAGAAFVDQRALMGGDGSVRSWARRRLAARDLVHLSRAGYERVAGELVDRLLLGYDARASEKGPGR